MKRIIILSLLMSGCSAFDIQHAERFACGGTYDSKGSILKYRLKTKFAASAELVEDGIVSRTQGRLSQVNTRTDDCQKQFLDVKKWQACTGYDKKCVMEPA